MLSLLLNNKSLFIGIIIALVGIGYGTYYNNELIKSELKVSMLSVQLAKTQAEQQTLEASVTRWKKEAEKYNKELKQKEKIIKKMNVQSDKKIKEILHEKYPSDCNEAIKKGLSRYHSDKKSKVKFTWENNIP